MKSKLLAFMAAVLVLSMLLGACTPATTQAPTTVPTSVPTKEVVPDVPTVEPVELVYWSMWNESEKQAEVLKAAIAEFEANHPGVTVKVNWAGRDVRKLLVPALEGGEKIDIIENDQIWLRVKVGKYLTVLDDYVTQPSYDVTGQNVLESLIPGTVIFSRDENGQLMNLPFQPYAVLYFYNKDIFAQAGVEKAPETWSEFVAAAEKIKAAGFDPLTIDPDAYIDILLGYYVERAKSCDFLLQTVTDTTGEMWKDPANIQLANDFGELAAKGLWSPQASANAFPAGQQEIALGTAAMYLNGTWFPSEVLETTGPDFQWGQFAFPAVTADKNNFANMEMGANAMAINVNSENKDLAFELLKVFVSNKYQTMMSEVANVPGITTISPWPASIADAFELVKSAENASPWACNVWDGGDVVTSVTFPIFQELVFGKITPSEFTEKMASEQAKFFGK